MEHFPCEKGPHTNSFKTTHSLLLIYIYHHHLDLLLPLSGCGLETGEEVPFYFSDHRHKNYGKCSIGYLPLKRTFFFYIWPSSSEEENFSSSSCFMKNLLWRRRRSWSSPSYVCMCAQGSAKQLLRTAWIGHAVMCLCASLCFGSCSTLTTNKTEWKKEREWERDVTTFFLSVFLAFVHSSSIHLFISSFLFFLSHSQCVCWLCTKSEYK